MALHFNCMYKHTQAGICHSSPLSINIAYNSSCVEEYCLLIYYIAVTTMSEQICNHR